MIFIGVRVSDQEVHSLIFLGQPSDDTIALKAHSSNNDYGSAITEILTTSIALISLVDYSGYLNFICAHLAVIIDLETLPISQS